MGKPKNYFATIKRNKRLEEGISIVDIYVPGFRGDAEPGQFVMLKINSYYDPFLRRPYSIFECNNEQIKILVKSVGRASNLLVEKKQYEKIEIFGPLGTGFTLKNNYHPVLIAGGIGLAPLWFLAKRLKYHKQRFSFIFGERTASQLGNNVLNSFGKYVTLTTDDGSRGFKGTVLSVLPHIIESIPHNDIAMYACGPVNMLRNIVKLSKKSKIPAYISLEERMACGIGVCLGCSVKKKGERAFMRVCKDGPVFNSEEVEI
ncbi:MAG: hypothetical protein B5M53_04500 [Candidatus Cloacimonas sp. 4484_209]|nr:MAG: hypothetical protein B5M53_04500 [Candidatus Cloacimonas sp. 4484_209]